jgi:RHS repeat-associated protein
MAEYNQYFYHSDHLGSASFITDATGYVDQHTMCRSIFYGVLQASLCSTNTNKIQIGMQYLPFGELFISQRNSTFDSRYKFTAKELDNETNYTYFGARYYDSDLSFWLSVDPASELYPSTSSYMYVRGNPVVLIDPNGMWDSKNRAEKQRQKAIKKYGSEFVGHLYFDDSKNEYGYRISPTGFQQHSVENRIEGSTVSADGGVEIFSNKTQKNFDMFGKDYGLNSFQRSFISIIGLFDNAIDFWSGIFGGPTKDETNGTVEVMSYWTANFAIAKFLGGFSKIKSGGNKRPNNNKVQNKQFKQVSKELNLTKNQKDRLHREIDGGDFDYHDLKQFAKDLFSLE